ncbi:unnamed protein product [Rhizophagus irregularis]|uniref:Uncharacterized protein n=1 Tax=Rhizophagus irregularis TaxID=588596 RepID=A0A916E1V6_9GLOM|nr:unnamed protein product [Rhizophagus irregularis]
MSSNLKTAYCSPLAHNFKEFSNSRNDLLNIQKDLINTTDPIYYTVGSLIDIDKKSCFMSFEFAQAYDSSSKVVFTSCCQHWPSSYRAESFAILTALIVSPPHYIY